MEDGDKLFVEGVLKGDDALSLRIRRVPATWLY